MDYTVDTLRAMPNIDLWHLHLQFETQDRDARLVARTLAPKHSCVHVPTNHHSAIDNDKYDLDFRQYMEDHPEEIFTTQFPEDMVIENIRDINGGDWILTSFTVTLCFDKELPWLFPELKPDNKHYTFDVIVHVKFKDGLISSERIYWDKEKLYGKE
jgi:carboxymethylenebutenolidase